MTAFAAAMDVLFTDPNLSAAATYIPAGDAARDVRVIVSRPDVENGFADVRVQSDTMVLKVRVSEVAQPRKGDVFILDGETRLVQGAPVRNRKRLVWRIDTRPA